MSIIRHYSIEGRDGLYLGNKRPVSFETAVSLPSVRIVKAEEMRELCVHKFIPLRYLLVLLKDQRLILNKVTTWEDPFENFFLKEHFVLEGCTESSHFVSVEGFTKGLYGMSWTLQDETDSLWRIYSPDKLSVRITVPAEIMVESVCSESNNWDVWINRVDYKGQKDIDKWLDDCNTVSSAGQFLDKLGESLFIKREAFVAEKEFRVVINCYDNSCPKSSFVCFKVNPGSLISSIITDPRLSRYEHDGIRAALIDAGVDARRVRQSQLYSFTPRTVEMKYDPFPDF